MWGNGTDNPMIPYFRAAKAAAANVPAEGERGTYTAEMFDQDFPQFSREEAAGGSETPARVPLVPETMLQVFIVQANDSVLPSRWGSLWRYAAGLYTAHFAAMYLKTYAPSSASAAQAAGNASQMGMAKSVSMGDTSVSYDNTAVTAGTEKWGAWNATQYGQQLVTLARAVGMGGIYVI